MMNALGWQEYPVNTLLSAQFCQVELNGLQNKKQLKAYDRQSEGSIFPGSCSGVKKLLPPFAEKKPFTSTKRVQT